MIKNALNTRILPSVVCGTTPYNFPSDVTLAMEILPKFDDKNRNESGGMMLLVSFCDEGLRTRNTLDHDHC